MKHSWTVWLASACVACSSSGGGGATQSASPAGSSATNAPPSIADPGPQQVAEDAPWEVRLQVDDPEGDPLRVFALDLPPGATWDEATRTLRFTPDFVQGGRAYTVRIVARDGTHEVRRDVVLDVSDTIRPPAPRVVRQEPGNGFTRWILEQVTDDYLDNAHHAGRHFQAVVTVPDVASAAAPKPVRIALHGWGGQPWRDGWEGEFRIAPHDPNGSYWWGYAEALPGSAATHGEVPDYSQRRILHLLGWVLETQPGADPERVYVEGASMGGAGAATFGLLRARHVAWVSATYGQWIPRNHRPSRLQQLSGLWGSPQANLGGVWDRMDLTRVLAESSEARDQALFLRHGKDDPIIHFGAVVHPSPRTGRSVYQALQHHRVGHVAVWDEGGHVREDPRLPAGWWSAGWNPIFDGTSSLRRDASFPAFSACSLDRDPGDGLGDGRPWDADAGYSGDPNVADDTGWTGQRAGARNRFCRWDATQAVDTLDQWSMPLRLASSGNGAASVAGDPTLGDTLPASSATVDVTPRRVQAFRCAPGEVVRWSFAGQSGSVTADLDGAVTVPGLTLTAQWETLTLSR